MARKRKRREQGSGAVRQLGSGRWQARYRDADGKLQPAPTTFDTRLDAEAWLAGDDPVEIEEKRADPALRDYAETWLIGRDLKPRTREDYRRLLDGQILPDLGSVRLSCLSPARVRTWYRTLDPARATNRAHAYLLLHAICESALRDDDLIAANPVHIRGAGSVKKKHTTKVASLEELTIIAESVPDRYRLMILMAAWLGLRFGELTELRRSDITADVVRVDRGVVRAEGGFVVGDPKSDAGKRSVAIPRDLGSIVVDHLAKHVSKSADSLLFPARGGGHMAPSTLYKVYYPARAKAGRPDLHFHDLRHTGASLVAATGATLADLMRRLGHATPSMAALYVHGNAERDRAIADALNGFYSSGAVPLAGARPDDVGAADGKVERRAS